MKKTMGLWALLSLLLFAAAWWAFLDMAVIPVGMLVGQVLVTFRYAVDKWGFGEIDTIAILRADDARYFQVVREYSLLYALGFVLAFWGLGGAH